SDKYIIRSKKRFDWNKNDLNKIKRYHRKVRKHLFYIHSPQRLWYLKRSGNMANLIDRSSLTITFAAMHKLSELARYSPMLLAKHFDSKHNWLLSEFIANAPSQFIDEIASEITGQEFMIPGVKSW
ncbi:MAG: YaaC family protein, partial [Cyanobacteria bacterium P01_E01_bin.35]